MISFYLAKFGLLALPIVLCRHTSNDIFSFSVCTHQQACLQRSQAVHFVSLRKNVNIYAKFLTSKVPFQSINRPTCRKKSILAKVCFGAKWG